MNLKLNKLHRIALSHQQLKKGGIAGRAFTPYTCICCESELSHPSTNTPTICSCCEKEIIQDNKSRTYVIKEIKNFINKLSDLNGLTLFDGRVIQAEINQDFLLIQGILPKHYNQSTKLEEISALSELEQDSIRGISDNLEIIKNKLRIILDEISMWL